MSQENVEIVEAAIAAYLTDDEVAVRELVVPDLVISTRPDQPDVLDHHGYEGLLRASAEWVEAWTEHTFEVVRAWDAGDFVFVCVRESGRGKTSGVPMETETTFLYTLSERKIIRLQIFSSEQEALKAVGLEG
jgi:ketosteroid isomerase-like protein